MRAYNPLNVDELGKNAARALMDYPSANLPPDGSFEGGGVYTIHYAGPFPAYADMADKEPIYVGKADLPGRRQGRRVVSSATPALYRRLSKHAETIQSAENLDLLDFSCRWLVLDPVWIGLTEQVLISTYRPIWNVAVDGFGNNDPGRGRHNQRRSQWDTLHPGRPWAVHLRDSADSREVILEAIATHRTCGSNP